MAAAVLMEEELQNSMATSEEDAEFEADDELAAETMAENTDAYTANIQLKNGMAEILTHDDEDNDEGEREEDEVMLSDEEAEGEEEEEDDDEDGEGVGAVKIQPGLLEAEDDAASGSEHEESVASIEDDDESKYSTDAEVEEPWEPAAEEDEEPANPNRCMCVSHTIS
jgi:histone acetyltransferase SAS3